MKYWAYLRGEVPGCYSPEDLVRLPDFALSILVCPAEGEIAEKNWRRASEIPEILKAAGATDHEQNSAKPASSASTDVNAFIDATGTKLFQHVSRIVKELENRREEQELLRRLELEIMNLKSRVEESDARLIEKDAHLKSEKGRIADLEKSLSQEKDRAQALEASAAREGQQTAALRVAFEKLRAEQESLHKRLGDAQNDLAIRNRLVNKLSLELTEKELQLAKSLGIIRKLEEDLPQMGAASRFPKDSSRQQEEAAAKPAPEPPRSPKPAAPGPSQAEAGAEEIPEENLAHKALVERLRKLVSRHTH
jgi:DNA repair exonuclease SbcCD ATPase subunit